MRSPPNRDEVDALRAWRQENSLPPIADPPLHWSDCEYRRIHHSRGRAVAVAEYVVGLMADLTDEIRRRQRR